MVRMAVYQRQGEVLVAACDSDIVGRVCREGVRKLEVSEDFYGSKEVSLQVLKEMLAQATIANLTGEEVVGAAIELGLISKENVITIEGVPHAQLFKMMR